MYFSPSSAGILFIFGARFWFCIYSDFGKEIMFGFIKMGTVHIPHFKNTVGSVATVMNDVKEVLLPLSQHIGAPATPIVKVGDSVTVGQKIAEAGGYVSSPIYASVSGKVTKIEDYLRHDGRVVPAIRIASDSLMTKYEGITPPEVNDLDGLISAARECGLVGLGGAGFPMSVKLDALRKGNIDTILFNGAECEPYITCDTYCMLHEYEWIEKGVRLFEKFAPDVANYVFGIEKNKPECVKKMNDIFKNDEKVRISSLPSTYPQGGEKILIYNTTGRIVCEGKLPADVNVIVINVTSLAILAKFVETGMPLVSRCVTVDGSAVASPKNVIAPIGTSIGELIEFSGGLRCDAGKVLYGGPMMGIPAASLNEPTLKTTGGITVLDRKDSVLPESTPCIHCGRCVRSCPLHLSPITFSKALKISDKDEKFALLEKSKVMLCMECGCCSYVCPASRPLVQNNRIAKGELREHLAHMANLKK